MDNNKKRTNWNRTKQTKEEQKKKKTQKPEINLETH